MKRTPLFQKHKELAAKLVPFAGWEMPVSYSGIKEEHLAVRERAGLFDVSHMGEIMVSGPDALSFLQKAACNNAARLEPGTAQYSALLNPEGGFIDDIFVYRLGEDEYFLCVNAANADKDSAWLSSLPRGDCRLENQSERWAQLALQGPAAEEIALKVFSEPELKRLARNRLASLPGNILIARTGYTGEDGFEIFLPPEDAPGLWDELLAAGREFGLLPCGLGARDTLRLEMGYPLHGHDITEQTTPLEADLAWIVDMQKQDFVGKAALARQGEEGVKQKRVGLVMEEAGVPREGYPIITREGQGRVTSGTKTPCLDRAVAMGYVPAASAEEGEEVKVEIRGKLKKARIKKWPFYRKK